MISCTWHRQTTSMSSASISTTLPLPSSPHWAPRTTVSLDSESVRALFLGEPLFISPNLDKAGRYYFSNYKKSRTRTTVSKASVQNTDIIRLLTTSVYTTNDTVQNSETKLFVDKNNFSQNKRLTRNVSRFRAVTHKFMELSLTVEHEFSME